MVQVKEGSRANMHPQLLVKGVGYDRLLGGFEIDTRLQRHLAKIFEVGPSSMTVFSEPWRVCVCVVDTCI